MKTPTYSMPVAHLPYDERPTRWTVMISSAVFVLLLLVAIAMNVAAAVLTGFFFAGF